MAAIDKRSLFSGGLGFLATFVLVWLALPERSAPEAASLSPVSPEKSVSPRGSGLLPEAGAPGEEAARSAVSSAVAEVQTPPAASVVQAEPEALGVLLHGLIEDAAGGALPNASVWFTDIDGEFYRGVADERGQYLLGPLPFGRHLVTAGKEDFHSVEVSLEITPPGPGLRQDFVLHPQQVIRVDLVTSQGEPALPALAAAELSVWGLNLVPVATREDPGATFTGVTGSLNNTFGIGGFTQSGMFGRDAEGAETYGFVTLYEDGDAWLSLVAAHQVLRKRPIDPSVTVVEFTLDPEDVQALKSELFARVLAAEDGTPIAAQGFVEDDPFAMRGGTEVKEDGLLHMLDLMPGKRWLILKAEGRAERVQRVELAPGQALELGDVLLHRPVELAGHVRTTTGASIAAELRWGELDPATGDVKWVQQRRAQSKPDGSFSLPGLEPGLYVVQAPGLPVRGPKSHDAKLASFSARADARQGSVLDLELVMYATTTITLASEGAAEPWPSVRAFDENGLRTDAAWLGLYGKESQLHLPPGRYTLEFRRDGVETERRELLVGSEAQRIELRFD